MGPRTQNKVVIFWIKNNILAQYSAFLSDMRVLGSGRLQPQPNFYTTLYFLLKRKLSKFSGFFCTLSTPQLHGRGRMVISSYTVRRADCHGLYQATLLEELIARKFVNLFPERSKHCMYRRIPVEMKKESEKSCFQTWQARTF